MVKLWKHVEANLANNSMYFTNHKVENMLWNNGSLLESLREKKEH